MISSITHALTHQLTTFVVYEESVRGIDREGFEVSVGLSVKLTVYGAINRQRAIFKDKGITNLDDLYLLLEFITSNWGDLIEEPVTTNEVADVDRVEVDEDK